MMEDNDTETRADSQERPILTPEERQERNRREMIDAILAVSRNIMREEGVAALNLHEIARRVGMSAPSLYNYFPSKMAIYEAIFARGMRQYRQGLEQVAAQHDSSAEGLQAALTYFMTFAQENPELFHLLFERPVPGFVPSEEGLQEIRELIRLSNALTRQQMDAGQIHPSISLELARDLFVAVMHGLTALHMANEPHLPVGEGRFGSLIPLAARAVELVYQHGKAENPSQSTQGRK